eukprot:TRINITY_DN1579_c1_g1_i5.p1 TRINITY_DN1579_c1_g1~~TRINITY_DN1579_c1_g1_i5.p1  ORF type:complete len:937 (+),score=253.12 TRINITY_DN1579_c1_g1_i5:64-2811(+)
MLASLLVLHLLSTTGCVIKPANLKANSLMTPYVDKEVDLSWEVAMVNDTVVANGQVMRGYRIVARSDGEVTWDSGLVQSADSMGVRYGGLPVSRQRVVWQVTLYDRTGKKCNATTASSWFEYALLTPSDWDHAEWLARDLPQPVKNECALFNQAPAPYFLANLIFLSSVPSSVTMYATGLGYLKIWVNSVLITPYMDPPLTNYTRTVFYRAFDISQHVTVGDNLVKVELGNGWWNLLPLLFDGRLNLRDAMPQGVPMFKTVTYVDDEPAIPSTPGVWVAGSLQTSPTKMNNIYLGEVYDARAADLQRNNTWLPPHSTPHVVSQGVGELRVAPIRGVIEIETLHPKQISAHIYDTTVNHAGTCEYTLQGGFPGSTAQFIYGELLYPDGTLNPMTSVAGQIKSYNPAMPCQPDVAYQQDTVILNGKTVTFKSGYTWHGMRYIKANLSEGVELVKVTCYKLRTDLGEGMELNTSDPKLNLLRQTVKNTFDSNMMGGIQSDCPHRERFGYSGDPLASGEAAMSLFELNAWSKKRAIDFNEAQRQNGGFTETAPYVGIHDASLNGTAGPIGWATYQPVLLLWLYKYYGEVRVLNESYAATTRYIELLDASPSGIENGLGDWMPVEPTGTDFTGRGFQLMSYRAYANISGILGYHSVQTKYENKAAQLVQAINDKFLDPSGCYGNGPQTSPYHTEKLRAATFNCTQTGQAMGLFMQVTPEGRREAVLNNLVENIKKASYVPGTGQGPVKGGPGPHLLSGMFGIKWVLQVLSETGYEDLAYEVATTGSYPSVLWMRENEYSNATTIWESWFFSDNVYSHNHPMFGSFETWMQQSLVGFAPHPSARGMSRVLIRPRPPRAVESLSARIPTVRGPVGVSWQLSSSTSIFTLTVTIPPNMAAVVVLPGGITHDIGSGTYNFTSML